MKKIISLLLALCLTLSLCACGGQQSDNKKQDDVSTTNKTENSEEIDDSTQANVVDTSEFGFIYDLNAIPDEWWDATNKELAEMFTNREVFELRAEKSLGNLNGRLSVGPVDFSFPVALETTGYIVSFENNNFVIPQYTQILDDKIEHVSAMMEFAVIRNDLMPMPIKLEVDRVPADIELKDGEWTIMIDETPYGTGLSAYYLLSDGLCLTLGTNSYHYEDTEYDNLEKMDYKDLEILVPKLCEMISVKEVDFTKPFHYGIERDDIKLSNGVTIKIKDTLVYAWDSGAKDYVSTKNERMDNHLTLINNSRKQVTITEYESNMNAHCNYWSLVQEPYNYNGVDLYLCKSNTESYAGALVGIAFEVDGIWYGVEYKGKFTQDVEDVDAWISEMIDGVLVIE